MRLVNVMNLILILSHPVDTEVMYVCHCQLVSLSACVTVSLCHCQLVSLSACVTVSLCHCQLAHVHVSEQLVLEKSLSSPPHVANTYQCFRFQGWTGEY